MLRSLLRCCVPLLAIAFVLPARLSAAPFRIPDPAQPTVLIVDPSEPELARTSARLLSEDLERLTGYLPDRVESVAAARGQAVLLATAGSPLARRFAPEPLLQRLRGQWETYAYVDLEDAALPGGRGFLVLGSDRRGLAYGVLALSRDWGVSPWVWWADVPAPHRDHVELPAGGFVSPSPAVKYRGIFINDEDWGLEPWAAHTFEPETGTIGPKTYARVCELLLRLHANLLWPAMHDCTRAFYRVPGNKEVADAYGIVIGTSHAEPMLRNNVDEWDHNARGDFNFVTNRERVLEYWRERVGQVAGTETLFTLGMRGIHDSPMVGVGSMAEKVAAMQEVLSRQREMLEPAVGGRMPPQVFVPYKEVLEAYDAGLKVPDDVTLMWTDDNFGYIRRLSSPEERKRPGRAGVYYHVSYWGQPHDYLWLATTHPMLVWEEMTKAYESGADRIWVLNVGDIKPAEYLTEFFMDLAVSPQSLATPSAVRQHLRAWASATFGAKSADAISGALWDYYALAFERRPEHLGWNTVEPIVATAPTTYNGFEFGDQIQRQLDRYAALERTVDQLATTLSPAARDAYFELVQYPVSCAAAMNRKVLYAEKAALLARQHRASANDAAALAAAAQVQIAAATRRYNEELAGGKWRRIMSAAPRNLPVFAPIPQARWTPAEAFDWGVMAEGPAALRPSTEVFAKGGGVSRARQLPAFTRGLNQPRFFDVFVNGPGELDWKASASAPWIVLSQSSGALRDEAGRREQRVWVSIDADRLPSGTGGKGTIQVEAKGKRISLGLTVVAAPGAPLKQGDLVESQGYVAFDASDFSKKRDDPEAPWTTLEGLGVAGASVGTLPLTGGAAVDPARLAEAAPFLEYTFHVVHGGSPEVSVHCLPTHPVDRGHGVRFAVAVDDADPVVAEVATQGRSPTWKGNVLSNRATARLQAPRLTPGPHRLRLYRVDPGVVFDSVTIDFGGLPPGYGHIAPTRVE